MKVNDTSPDFDTDFTTGDIIYLSSLSPLLLVIIIGNLICLQVLRFAEDFRPATKTFMTSLAVSDLFFGLNGLYSQLLFVAHEFNWTLAQSSIFCYLNAFPGLYFPTTGSVSVLLLNFDVYVVIVKPLRYHMILTRRRATLITISAWLVLLVWGVILFVDIFEPSVMYLPKHRMCFLIIARHSIPAQVFGLIYIVFIAVGPAFVILVIYIKIYCISKTHHKRLQAIGMNTNMAQRAQIYGNRKAEASVVLVTIGYFIGWIPFTICFCVEYLLSSTDTYLGNYNYFVLLLRQLFLECFYLLLEVKTFQNICKETVTNNILKTICLSTFLVSFKYLIFTFSYSSEYIVLLTYLLKLSQWLL